MRIVVKVKTGSKIDEVKKVSLPADKRGENYEIKIKARPIEGQANQELIRTLSEFFRVPRDRVTIKSGLKSKNKIINIAD